MVYEFLEKRREYFLSIIPIDFYENEYKYIMNDKNYYHLNKNTIILKKNIYEDISTTKYKYLSYISNDKKIIYNIQYFDKSNFFVEMFYKKNKFKKNEINNIINNYIEDNKCLSYHFSPNFINLNYSYKYNNFEILKSIDYNKKDFMKFDLYIKYKNLYPAYLSFTNKYKSKNYDEIILMIKNVKNIYDFFKLKYYIFSSYKNNIITKKQMNDLLDLYNSKYILFELN